MGRRLRWLAGKAFWCCFVIGLAVVTTIVTVDTFRLDEPVVAVCPSAPDLPCS